ncbi:MAG: hypothetical protein ACI8T1_004006, partial [Verrucomicrobiales bacterium]
QALETTKSARVQATRREKLVHASAGDRIGQSVRPEGKRYGNDMETIWKRDR